MGTHGMKIDGVAPARLPRALPGKAVVTGASGFIGRRLVDALVLGGTDVVTLRRGASPKAERVRSAEVDYAKVESLVRVLDVERPDWVFHVAGSTKGVTYDDFAAGNVVPTRNLLDACAVIRHRPARFVHVSSLAAYGPSTLERPHDEADERKPIEFYGQSKLEAERVVETHGAKLPFTIIRPGGVYGPGDVDYFEYFKLVSQGLNVFFGNRRRVTSMVYVDDVVWAIIEAAASPNAVNRGYFVCDGDPVSFEGLQGELVRLAQRPVLDLDLPEFLVPIAARFGELMTSFDKKPRLYNRQKAEMGRQDAWTCAHTRARADFGYVPAVPRGEGLRRTFDWYRSEGWL
ncbi:NAD-dependent epimerase/dehydratase family protein [Myxococcota bacterium]|nr:NAD-dependent epimerase/dehydratase family protein [Myxococcota bacterium]